MTTGQRLGMYTFRVEGCRPKKSARSRRRYNRWEPIGTFRAFSHEQAKAKALSVSGAFATDQSKLIAHRVYTKLRSKLILG